MALYADAKRNREVKCLFVGQSKLFGKLMDSDLLRQRFLGLLRPCRSSAGVLSFHTGGASPPVSGASCEIMRANSPRNTNCWSLLTSALRALGIALRATASSAQASFRQSHPPLPRACRSRTTSDSTRENRTISLLGRRKRQPTQVRTGPIRPLLRRSLLPRRPQVPQRRLRHHFQPRQVKLQLRRCFLPHRLSLRQELEHRQSLSHCSTQWQ